MRANFQRYRRIKYKSDFHSTIGVFSCDEQYESVVRAYILLLDNN